MDRSANYCKYYLAQRGGEIPVFRGGRQSGEGLGDILRGILRFIAPIALRGISTFAGHTLDAHQKGATLKDAAKSALGPTLSSVTSGFSEQFRGNQEQTGSGLAALKRQSWRQCKKSKLPVKKSRNVYKKAKCKLYADDKFDPAVAVDAQTHYNF